MFECVCGRKFEKILSLNSHKGHCEQYLGYKPKNHFEGKSGWAKGLTKETDERIKHMAERLSQDMKGKIGNLSHVTEESIKERSKKQSETMKKSFRDGTRQPAEKSGRGKGSYFIHEGKRVFLRSTFEFIFALYTAANGKSFKYETISVHYENRTYRSDFLVDGKLVEVKGYRRASHDILRKAFENAGYSISFVYAKEFLEMRTELDNKGYDTKNLIKLIIDGANQKNYVNYEFGVGVLPKLD